MYKLCKTESSAKRQRNLELALLNLMKNMHYDEITVSGICESIDVPRKAFYRYFESKDGALYALIDHTMMQFHENEGKYTERVRRSLEGDIEQLYIFFLEKRDFLDALERSGLSDILIQRAMKFSLSGTINLNKFLPDENEWMREQVLNFSVCGLMMSVLAWYRAGYKKSTREMARMACRMLSEPLFPNIKQIVK